MPSKVIFLDQERNRRIYIDIANSDENYVQIKASFSLSGIELTDDDAELAGRIIAGKITYKQAAEELQQKYAVERL